VNPVMLAIGLAVGLGGPACVYAAGNSAWALGLWIGQALGLGVFIWIRAAVRQAFAADAVRPPLRRLLWHGGLRVGVTAAVLIGVIQTPAIEIWAVILGYTLVQFPALWWQARTLPRNVRGVL